MYRSLIVLTLLASARGTATPAPVPIVVPTPTAVAPDDVVATPGPTSTPMPTASRTKRLLGAPARVQDASAISAMLTMPSTTFKAGSPIALSITLRNAGGYPFGLPSSPPWFIIHLVITDGSGRSVDYAGTDPQAMRTEVMHYEQLPPGGEKALMWNGVSTFHLSDWGATLKQGDYVIRAIPHVETSDSTVDGTIRSNALIIHVE